MQTFRSLRHRNYRLYFFGQMVSLIGSWMQSTVVAWLAYDLTHQARWPAFLMAAQIGPTFLLGAWGGSLADRFPKRNLILLTQLAFLCSASLLLFLIWADLLYLWLLLLVMLCQGTIQAIDLPARLAFVPDLVTRDDLINVVALNSLLFNTARTIGPALAAYLLIHLGAGWCVLLNLLSYIAVLFALLLMQNLPAHNTIRKEDHSLGFTVIRQQPTIFLLVRLAGIVAISGWPLMSILPAFADQVLLGDATAYGTLLSSTGLGAFLSALTIATYGKESRRLFFLINGVGLVVCALLGLSQMTELLPAAICCGLFGFGMISFFATGQAIVQLSADSANRGKIMGVWAMMLSGGVPLGNLLIGPSADIWGVTTVMQGMAGMLFLVVGILWIRRTVLQTPLIKND